MSKDPILEHVANLRKQHCATYLKSTDEEQPHIPFLTRIEKSYVAKYKKHVIDGETEYLKNLRTEYENKVAQQMAENAHGRPENYKSRAQEVVRGSSYAIDRMMGLTR